MKHVIDISEVVGNVDMPEGECEVCASAVAQYDEEAGRLVTNLDSFLRTTDLRKKERRLTAEWLPRPQTVTEGVGPEETIDVAKEVFQRWVAKVRDTTPEMHLRKG
jgi:hypothetical protein